MIKKVQNSKKTFCETSILYQRAEKEWSRGRLRSAFSLFLAAAKAGFIDAFLIVGTFYDYGMGTRKDVEAALYWYRKAYRYRNDETAANNIGCIWRDRGNLRQAIKWFRRAVELGDCDANLNIAKIYLDYKHNFKAAVPYLKKVVKSHGKSVTEYSKEEAALLLERIRKKTPSL